MKTESNRITCQDVLSALRRWHEQPCNGKSRAWVYAEEVRVATGWGRHGEEEQYLPAEQRIDAFALHTWSSKRFQRIAYEVKVSRSDLLRELSQPYKAAPALALSNYFYLVVPAHVKVTAEEVPAEWGIKKLTLSGRLQTIRLAPWRDTPNPPYSFMLSLARNLQARADFRNPQTALSETSEGLDSRLKPDA